MTGQDSDDFDLNDDYDFALAEEVLRVIERYADDEDINLRPLMLRNSMLALAALLHLQANEHSEPEEASINTIRERFADAALNQLDTIAQARKLVQYKN